MRLIILIYIVISFINAKDIKPFLKIDAGAIAEDIALVDNNSIIIGTAKSEAKVYNYIDKKFIKTIKIPKIKDFMGDIIDARVSNVDYLNGKYLLLSDSGIGGYADLRINENNKTVDIFTENDKLPIIKAKFIDDNNILLGFLSDEVALYNIKNKTMTYKKQLTPSKFSNFALNKKRELAAFTCESGEVTVIQTKNGKTLKVLSGINLDNVFDVDIKNNIVTTAGKDRRAGWYNLKNNKKDYIQAKFFIYATALNPDASMAAWAMDEDNTISIYKLFTKSLVYKLIGQKSTLNKIIFKDDKTLFSASNDNIVIMWKLK